MVVTIICVGKPKEKFIAAGVAEYAKRLPSLTLLTVKASTQEKESSEIIRLCQKKEQVFLLDEAGKVYSSTGFAALLKPMPAITLVIGGADGFSPALKTRWPSISLSALTLPHELALLVLVEQVYRAHMINTGRTYHRQ